MTVCTGLSLSLSLSLANKAGKLSVEHMGACHLHDVPLRLRHVDPATRGCLREWKFNRGIHNAAASCLRRLHTARLRYRSRETPSPSPSNPKLCAFGPNVALPVNCLQPREPNTPEFRNIAEIIILRTPLQFKAYSLIKGYGDPKP